MKKVQKRCPHCNAKMVEYRHSLTRNLVRGLFVLLDEGGTIKFSALRKILTYNQTAAFQRLRYWGLTTKMRDPATGERRDGLWGLTELGHLFITGKATVSKVVWTYRNEPIRSDAEQISVRDLKYEPYMRRADYVATERPHFIDPNGQLQIFGEEGKHE